MALPIQVVSKAGPTVKWIPGILSQLPNEEILVCFRNCIESFVQDDDGDFIYSLNMYLLDV